MKLDLGIWNNTFSIPTKIADEYLTKCDFTKLKVLIYLLRFPGKDILPKEISEKLSLNLSDVDASLNYWINEGIFNNLQKEYTQKTINISSLNNKYTTTDVNIIPPAKISFNTSAAIENLKQLGDIEQINKSIEPITIAPRLTLKEALDRINKDDNLKFLINEAPKILKRNITSTDTIIIISFIDWTSISVDLVLMLMNYCASINKKSAKWIEKEGYNWVNSGIDTHEKAEQFIKENIALNDIQYSVMFAFHKTYLTEREKTFIKKWVTNFNYDIKMIKLAYETAVTRKGEKDFSYINGILSSWFKKGILTPNEVDDENKVKLSTSQIKTKNKNKGIFKFKNSDSFTLEDLKAKMCD